MSKKICVSIKTQDSKHIEYFYLGKLITRFFFLINILNDTENSDF